jgi:DEAD/DEAH box helicase domain-containing protein
MKKNERTSGQTSMPGEHLAELKKIGLVIRELRFNYGLLTQKELSDRCGVHFNTIQSIEHGDKNYNFLFYHLKLENLNLDDKHLFINEIVSYLKENEEKLLDQFISAYDFITIQESFNELKISLRSDFYPNLRKSIQNVKIEFDHIQERINDINKYIKKKNLSQNDPEVIELRGELKNLRGMIKNIKKRQIIEHLTNVGILPNYAFPETGVILNAQIRLNNSTETNKDYRIKSLEIVRPSKSAIHELNPDNFFYTQGYRLRISGVNTFGYKDKVMTYRYCSNCDHLDIDTIDVQNQNCPKCNDPSWNSSSNTHNVLKMENFISFEYEKNAVITDAREEREQLNCIVSRHFTFNAKSLQGAWATKNIPFGIEYVKEVDITEVNTGVIRDFFDRSRITTINGKDVPSAGYIVCRYCGKATSTTFNEEAGKPKEAGDFHYGFCKHKEVIYQSKGDEVFDEIYFLRSLKTEAIKILLPVQEFESESSISMFRAGILLGLKHYYGGNPQHLEIIPYSEVNAQTQKKDRYLVMYDVIPGGTGYLSKLFDKTEFSKVLLNTYESIKNCSCQNEGKDGCYRCIFSYGNQHEREKLSRIKAEKEFERIYKSIDYWDYLEEGLGKVTNSGRIEESELEERFINILARYYNRDDQKEKGWSFEPRTEDGITKYLLNISHGDVLLNFEVRPQVPLTLVDGVSFSTRPDFIITLLYALKEGEEVK